MNEIYIDMLLRVQGDIALRELLSYQLHEIGFTGLLDDEDGLHCYILKQQWTPHLSAELEALWKAHHHHTITVVNVTEIENQNWNRLWEESIQPIEVTPRILITPSWHQPPLDSHDIVLIIDPKMSFGTGYHESTRLMLRLLEQSIMPGSIVLDVGTGTGILAIAAVKLGARSAVGVDVDEWSSSNGKENVERNGLGGRIDIRTGSLDAVPESGFTMILANITRNTILELLPAMLSKLAPSGALLLSGLLRDDRGAVEDALGRHQCAVIAGVFENEWIGIAARRS